MIAAMMNAAEAARKGTDLLGNSKMIEILITEIGIVVRGQCRRGDFEWRASNELAWREFFSRPQMLVDSVRLTDRRLIAALESGQAQP